MRFTPNPWLFLFTVLGILVGMALIVFFWQGHHDAGYLLAFAIAVMVFPCITWVSYVPSRFEMSDDFLHIRFAFRGDHQIAWNDLKAWGDGADLAFVLQVANHGTFQIALFAFPKGQRQHLI